MISLWPGFQHQGKLERAKSQAASELAAAAQGDNAEELRKVHLGFFDGSKAIHSMGIS